MIVIMMNLGYYGRGMVYDWGMGWLVTVFFWGLIILGIVYLIKLTAGSRRKKPFEESPLDILKRRYANGELTREEFEKIKDELKSD